MHLDKENRGYILLEVLILLNIISILILLSSKIIVENITKAKLYQIKNDILTLNLDESSLIKEAIVDINNNEELCGKMKDSDKVKDVDYLYNYSKDSNLNIKIKEGKIFLIRKDKSGDLYRAMTSKIKKIEDKEKVILIPTSYIEYNLNF